jgi:chemotaxis signal transduction protein
VKSSVPPSVPLAAMLSGSVESIEPEGTRHMLLFEAGGTLYALDAASVEVIAPRLPVTPLPFAPGGVLGVASVRGRMRLVVDPLGGAGVRRESFTKLIALYGDAQLAVIADRVVGLHAVIPAEIEPPEGEGRVAGTIRLGAVDALVLDPERLVEIETTR